MVDQPDFYEISIIGRYPDGSVHVQGWEVHQDNVSEIVACIDDGLKSKVEIWYTPEDAGKIGDVPMGLGIVLQGGDDA